MKKLYGVTTAMITPMRADGTVDKDALRQLVEFQIARGAHCLYPCGTTGEMFRLTAEERKGIAKTVVNQARGRATVYLHTGAMRQEETLELTRHAVEIGADGVGVVTPAFFGATDDELFAYYEAVSQVAPQDFPIYLYNIPQCAANDLKPALVRRIAERCPNVVGIKYSLADAVRTDEYVHTREDFSVMQGTDRLLLPMLAMGCDGTVSGVANVYPELFVAVYDAWTRGDVPGARAAQTLATEACNLLRCGSNMAYFKRGLAHRSVPAGHMRAPQRDLSPAEAEALERGMDALEARLPKGLLTV